MVKEALMKDRPLDPEEMSEVRDLMNNGLELLAIAEGQASPDQLQEAICR